MLAFITLVPLITLYGILYLTGSNLISISFFGNRLDLVYFDQLSQIMLIYISILSFFIISYAKKNFERERNGSKWLFWFFISLLSVQFLVMNGDLLLTVLAFISISLSFHNLLLAFPQRQKSKLAATKKFILSRLGDLSFLLGAFFFYKSFGTFNIQDVISHLNDLDLQTRQDLIFLPSIFIAFACLIKSAQFPFHFWLPETIDSPTPVSALMHAGIINAGGFILVRLRFLYEPFNLASILILGLGLITIFLGGISMLAQSDVKRKLAFSTIGQMGFMMVEFGLGLYPMVILHLMGHGFYKAYGFLASGSRDIVPSPKLHSKLYRTLLAGFVIIVPQVVFIATNHLELTLVSIFIITLIGFLPLKLIKRGILITITLVLFVILIPEYAMKITAIPYSTNQVPYMISLSVILCLSILSGFTLSLPFLSENSFVQKLYCYAQRGFLSNYLSDKFIYKLF
ncbi:MAG TPA: proton-conducting transporter membrane subunit [Leptospiraceae bacterium]|nr:proton-conducting transporter membrane subunit [Leptospiraceae bacterium]HMW04059.1 proton-conducting transporter membrane subunit [Leptospiraceae bacterium]HMX30949.1 proton-conducting transporter membrane subunit [Leptospiraceae bacterium]HMY30053.1 proton-conducting transporter membrane subunit [Leptospiraceae bacterium]HMZ62760.1 proton-conducting transporter membrane subunit [Leptospiraceae bacterium]